MLKVLEICNLLGSKSNISIIHSKFFTLKSRIDREIGIAGEIGNLMKMRELGMGGWRISLVING